MAKSTRSVINPLAVLAGLGVVLATATGALAVGEPQNLFSLTVTQGANVIVNNPAVPVPSDIKTNDGDPLSFVQVGTTAWNTPIILKLESDGGPNEAFRILHFYIDAPASVNDIDAPAPAPASLFNPNSSDPITVTVSGLSFAGTPSATPLVVGNNTFYVSYMRDQSGGFFYEIPGSNLYNSHGNGIIDIQVPGEKYVDGLVNPYNFTATAGPAVSMTWANLINPGTGTTVNDGIGNSFLPLVGDRGRVFELGLGVAFVPEPATMVLVAGGLLGMLGRRRTRN